MGDLLSEQAYATQNKSVHSERFILVPMAFGFLLNVSWSLFEVCRHEHLIYGRHIVESSSGWQMRRRFHLLLFLSNSVRLAAIIVEILLDPKALDRSGSQASWFLGMIHGIPDLMFLSTYGLLIVFYAQLYYATYGVVYRALKPCFKLVNCVLYLLFGVLAIATYAMKEYSSLRQYSLYLLTFSYLISLIGISYYGWRVTFQLTPKADYNFPARKMILRRIAILCVLFGFVFAGHTIHGLLSVILLQKNDLGYPPFMNRYLFDSLQYTLLEFCPSFITLYLTARKRPHHLNRDLQEEVIGSENSADITPLLES